MKCVFAIKSLEASRAGAERVFTDLANGLSVRGHRISVVSYDTSASKASFALNSNVEWIRLGIGRTDHSATMLETARRIGTLRRTFTALEPGVAVGFMHSMFIPLGLALLGTGIPIIASEHAVPAHYTKRPLERALLRLTPWLVRRIIVVSEQVLAEYPPSLRSRMVAIPNPVHAMPVVRADAVGADRPRKVALSVGRLTDQKDYATLVNAFARIAHRYPDWDLRIVGDGECRDELQARVLTAGLEGRVFLPGTTADVGSEYSRAQFFVTSSRYESHGLALAEALAHGLPAVGFANCLGVNRLIRHGVNGELVSNPNRVQALAEALDRMMADSHARARLVPPENTLPEAHSLERVLDCWEVLLNEHRTKEPGCSFS